MTPDRRCLPLGAICDFVNGNGFGPSDRSHSGLPIIRIQNLNGSEDFNYFGGVPKPGWLVEPGSLLFAWAGVKGVSFGPTIWNGPRGVLNQHIYRVAQKDGIDRFWLYCVLRYVTAQIERKAHGFKTSLVHVHKADLADFVVNVPSISEQRCIAAILLTWEHGLDRLGRQIQEKRAIFATLRESLTSSRRRVGSRASRWKIATLGDATQQLNGRNKSRFGREEVMGVLKTVGLTPMKAHVIANDIDRYLVVPPQAFAYNPMRVNIGSIAMSEFGRDVIVSPDYVVFACDPKKLLPGYLNHLRRTRKWEDFVTVAGNGSVRVRIYYADLASFEFPLPRLEEQRLIVEVLDDGERELSLLRAEHSALERQRDSLAIQLLTGRLRVGQASAPGQERL